jgi:hypothetical protein
MSQNFEKPRKIKANENNELVTTIKRSWFVNESIPNKSDVIERLNLDIAKQTTEDRLRHIEQLYEGASFHEATPEEIQKSLVRYFAGYSVPNDTMLFVKEKKIPKDVLYKIVGGRTKDEVFLKIGGSTSGDVVQNINKTAEYVTKHPEKVIRDLLLNMVVVQGDEELYNNDESMVDPAKEFDSYSR